MSDDYLVHHGILGMKWGVRRYQNPDGSLTELGKKHYNTPEYQKEKAEADLVKSQVKQAKADAARKEKTKKIVRVVAGVALTAGAVYAVKKVLGSSGNKKVAEAAKTAAEGKETVKKTFAEAFKETANARKETMGAELGAQLANSGADIVKSAFGVPGKIGKVLVEGAALTAGMALVKNMIGEKKLNQTVDAYNSYNKKNKVSMNPFKDNYKPAKEEDKEDD